MFEKLQQRSTILRPSDLCAQRNKQNLRYASSPKEHILFSKGKAVVRAMHLPTEAGGNCMLLLSTTARARALLSPHSNQACMQKQLPYRSTSPPLSTNLSIITNRPLSDSQIFCCTGLPALPLPPAPVCESMLLLSATVGKSMLSPPALTGKCRTYPPVTVRVSHFCLFYFFASKRK